MGVVNYIMPVIFTSQDLSLVSNLGWVDPEEEFYFLIQFQHKMEPMTVKPACKYGSQSAESGTSQCNIVLLTCSQSMLKKCFPNLHVTSSIRCHCVVFVNSSVLTCPVWLPKLTVCRLYIKQIVCQMLWMCCIQCLECAAFNAWNVLYPMLGMCCIHCLDNVLCPLLGMCCVH